MQDKRVGSNGLVRGCCWAATNCLSGPMACSFLSIYLIGEGQIASSDSSAAPRDMVTVYAVHGGPTNYDRRWSEAEAKDTAKTNRYSRAQPPASTYRDCRYSIFT